MFEGFAEAPNDTTSELALEVPPSESAEVADGAISDSGPNKLQIKPEAPAPESAKETTPPTSTPISSLDRNRELLIKANAALHTRTVRNLEMIMNLFEKKEKITNDDVEEFLKCSDATARRYLNELVKQGKIKWTGKTGLGVFYTKA